jgi:glycosyltransferase involved in cell wall biosynthesis
VALLFGLAVTALALRGLQAIGLHPVAGLRAGRIPAERRRLVLFIPSMGIGGAQRQLVYFLEHLDPARWAPELVVLDVADKFFEPVVRALGVPITYLNRGPGFWMSGVVWRLARHLHAHPCHILHSWLHYAVALGSIAGGLVGVPVIVGSLRSERPGRFPWFYPKWQRGIDIVTAPLHATILANSNAVSEECRRWAFIRRDKLLTVYNGIAMEGPMPDRSRAHTLRAHLGLLQKGPLVGIVGRLSPEKDHATFLKAAALISRARPDARFLIVGEGPMYPRIELEIARLGLTGVVAMLGGRKDAQALIQALDVLVMTSTSEGFPNVILEAATGGTPVVATDAGGVAEVVLNGETGFVVPCGDEQAVSGRVLELISDPVLSREVAQAAWERVKACFSAEQSALAMQACYERDLSGAGKPTSR